MNLDATTLQRCMPRAPRTAVELYAPPLSAAAVEFGQDDPNRLAAALASAANESGQLSRFEEASYFGTPSDRIALIFGGRAPPLADLERWKAAGRDNFDVAFFDYVYGNLMGNDGQGYKYRGLGIGQITGRANCRAVGKAIGVDLVANPERMLDPVIGSRAFMAYLKINRVTDPAVDGSESGFLASVHRSNPGLAEDEFRTHHLARWREVRAGLGLDASGNPSAPSVRPMQAALNVWLLSLMLVEDNQTGPKTRGAIRLYQFANGLRVTGEADPGTRAKIGVPQC